MSNGARELRAAGTPLPIDSDGDGCSDAEEMGSDAMQGGGRDPQNPYDFFDTPVQDKASSGIDFFAVLGHFNASAANPAGPPRYDPAFDRTPAPMGADPWDSQAPDGAISGLDFFASLAQFNHECDDAPPFYNIVNPAFTALSGATAYYGTYSGGAYRMEVPSSWNGGLVLWAHGFRGYSPNLSTEFPPERAELLARGYAWASSSYRANGYVPGFGARDTLALKDRFSQIVGTPTQTIIAGGSLGGNVVSLSLEQAPGEYDGGLALCGALTGVEILDYFAATWPAVAGFVTGVSVPDPQTATPQELMDALDDAHAALGTVGSYTTEGDQFKNIIINYTGGPRPLSSEGFDDWYEFSFLLLDVGLNAQAKNVPAAINQNVAENEDAVYHIDNGLGLTDQEINDGVLRISADDQLRADSEFEEFVPMTGQLSTPLMALHTTADYFVPIGVEVSYLDKVQTAGMEDLLVQRAYIETGHCAFDSPDVLEAFDDLVEWIDTDVKPWGDDLSGDLSGVGH